MRERKPHRAIIEQETQRRVEVAALPHILGHKTRQFIGEARATKDLSSDIISIHHWAHGFLSQKVVFFVMHPG